LYSAFFGGTHRFKLRRLWGFVILKLDKYVQFHRFKSTFYEIIQTSLLNQKFSLKLDENDPFFVKEKYFLHTTIFEASNLLLY
jgi:hypothetical protein